MIGHFDILFRDKKVELQKLKENKDFVNAIKKIDEIRKIPERPSEWNDAKLLKEEAILINNLKADYEKAFLKIEQALQLSNTDEDIRGNYKTIGMNLIKGKYKNKSYIDCEILIDKYLNNTFIDDERKNDCFLIKGLIFLEREEYERAFESLYSALNYYKNNNKDIKKYLDDFFESGVKVYKTFISNQEFQKADNSYQKVTEIITEDILVYKYKLDCSLINNKWEDSYNLVQSIEKLTNDDGEKEILKKMKQLILSNCISDYLEKDDYNKCDNYIKQLYDLDSSKAFNLEVKLIKKKLSKQFENHENEKIITFIDEKLKTLDKNKYFVFYSYLEKFRQEAQTEKLRQIYKDGKIDDYLNEVAKNGDEQSQEKKEIYNLASEIFNDEAENEIQKGNLEKAEEKINKGIEKNPDNINLKNTRAALNYEKGDFDEALKDINNILEKEPENNKIINNKLTIIEKKYEKDNEKLNLEDKNFIKQNCYKSDDINMKSKSLDIMMQLSDKENINLTNDDIQNINVEENNNIQNISVMSKTALLLKKGLDQNNSIKLELDEESKAMLEKSLNSDYKETKNNVLSMYKHISNLEKKDMEKPLEIISDNLKFNMYTKESKESIKILEHFIEKEESLELNQDLKTNLIINIYI